MAYWSLALAALFWGGNYVVGKMMVVHMDPVLLSELRWTLTSAILVAFNIDALRNSWPIVVRSVSSIIPLAILGQVLFPVTLYVGLQSTSSLNAAIYLSATPSIVLLLNWLFFRDYISRSNIIGVAISTTGVAWLVTKGGLTGLTFLGSFNQGDLWTMISAVSWGVYCSFLRKKPKELAGNVFVTVCAIVGAATLIPFSAFVIARGASAGISMSSGTVVGLAYLVTFPSWLSYLLWSRGIAAIGATRGEVFTHIIPLSAGILSVVFLGTRLSSYHVESVIMICIGVYLCAKHDRQPTIPAKANRAFEK